MEANALAWPPGSLTLRPAADRARTDRGWMRSHHSLLAGGSGSLGSLGPLHLLDEHLIAAGEGRGAHLHQDMEILVWVLDGALEHQDSGGHLVVLEPGELGRLRAGHGARHSEYNASDRDPVRLLEIWVQPALRGLEPDFERRRFEPGERRGTLKLIASEDGTADSVQVEQRLRIYAGLFSAPERTALGAEPARLYYAHCTRGGLGVNGCALRGGDGLELRGVSSIEVAGSTGDDGELLLFDLPRT
ncbi:MAG: pirin family protein [Gammaproteobacteria bacterium]|nr:pirin family protein [Gammaproteobacteria bacterium]